MKSLRFAIVAACIAVIAVPAAADAKQGSHGGGKLKANASRLCKQLKKDMTAEPFRAAYGNPAGSHNAHGKCVKYTKRTLKSLRKAARVACQSASAAHNDGAQNGSGKGKAKRTCLREETSDDVAAVKQAQTECRTELAADAAVFDTKYGSDEDDANDEGRDDSRNDDFADCVDEHAKAADAANDA
jgi:hypothetical protein